MSLIELTVLSLNIREGQTCLDAPGVHSHCLGNAFPGLGGLALGLVARLLQQSPVAHVIQCRLPARAAVADSAVQKLLSFAQTVLLLTHHTEPTQSIRIIRLVFQACGKGLLGTRLITFIQRLEPTLDQRIRLPGRYTVCSAGFQFTFVQQVTNFLIIWMSL